MTPKTTLLIYAVWGIIDILLWLYDWTLGITWLISGLMMPQLTDEGMAYVNNVMNYKPPKKPTNDDHQDE